MSGWPNLSELSVGDGRAPVGLVGAPLAAGSVTPGRCDQAPALLRADAEADRPLRRRDRARAVTAVPITATSSSPACRSSRRRSRSATRSRKRSQHALTLLVGGNNAVTRPGRARAWHAARQGRPDHARRAFRHARPRRGLSNGNPVRALIEDGLPGANIAQIGLASFANSRQDARGCARGGQPRRHAWTRCAATESRRRSSGRSTMSAHCEAIVVDCDIDVIDRSQFPAAPGARPGGMAVARFLRRGAPARGRSARAADRPDRMGPAARPDRSQRFDRGALGRRVPCRLRDAPT